MASIKISELEEVTKLSTSDVLPIVNENKTKKVSLEKLNEILGGSEGGTSNNEIYDIVTTKYLTGSATLDDTYDQFSNVMSKYVTGEITLPTFRLKNNTYASSTPELLFRLKQISGSNYIYESHKFLITGSSSNRKLTLNDYTLSLTVNTTTGSVSSANFSFVGYQILGSGFNASYTPTDEYNPVTKKYVDEAIANLDIPEGGGESGSVTNEESGIFAIDVSGSRPTNSTSALPDTVVDKMVAAFKNNKEKGLGYPAFLMRYSNGPVLFVYRDSNYTTNLYKTLQYVGEFITYSKRNARTVYTFSVNVRGFGYSSTTEIDIQDDVRISRYKEDNSLNIDNTEEYTPTADYHPSTKKYVDDSIRSAITSVLEAEY